jgi:hypothetical protein
MGTPKLGELIDPRTGMMQCKVCGWTWLANIRPDSNGRLYRGSWQCPYGCTPEDLWEMKKAERSEA